MRIAILSEQATPLASPDRGPAGGAAWQAAELAAALGRAGHEVRLYARRDDPDQPTSVPLGPGASLVHVPAGPARPVPEAELLALARPFGEQLAASWSEPDWRPELVHAHYWLSGLAALVAGRAVRAPIVLTYQELGSRRRRYLGDQDTSPDTRVGFERELGRGVDRVFSHCKAETSELIRLGVPRRQVTTVPLGVDPDRFAPAGALGGPATPPGRGRSRVVMVGSATGLPERKGYADAIAALRLVPDAELVVVGGPDRRELRRDQQARKLRAVAASCGMADRVRLVGQVSRDEVAGWYASADLVTCASWYDSFGITAVEGMAAGRPVVATRVGGFPDTVVDGLTGLLVPPRQPAALGHAMRAVLADPLRRVEYAAAGLDRVRQVYSWDRVATRVTGEYEQLCGR